VRVDGPAPSPPGQRGEGSPHLRWHPLRDEWVAYAPYRQDRTFLPPAEWDPLAPTTDPSRPTELPAGVWDVAVFENRFPSLVEDAAAPPSTIVATATGTGTCEVVVFTQAATGSLGALPLWHVTLLIDVWADRTTELGRHPDVVYVMPFENRGVEVGVTLPHPHGQIYAYSSVPPIPAREVAAQRRHWERAARGLFEEHVAAEIADERRLVHANATAVAFVPACARYPYELWVAPRRAAATLSELAAHERADLARALKTALLRLDGLWDLPVPYILVVHQAPTDGAPHPEAHVHVEIYPAYRSARRLKYLAGTEIGAGMFANDVLPEDAAAALRCVAVTIT
jgi:UDPglucose--hexose-1-phosphate uridylyltransferase